MKSLFLSLGAALAMSIPAGASAFPLGRPHPPPHRPAPPPHHPAPPPHRPAPPPPHRPPPRPVPVAGVCNANYYGGYYHMAGPLQIALRPTGWGNQVQVTLVFRNVRYSGVGACDGRAVRFDLRGGYSHDGRFVWGPRGWTLEGRMFVNGRVYDQFAADLH